MRKNKKKLYNHIANCYKIKIKSQKSNWGSLSDTISQLAFTSTVMVSKYFGMLMRTEIMRTGTARLSPLLPTDCVVTAARYSYGLQTAMYRSQAIETTTKTEMNKHVFKTLLRVHSCLRWVVFYSFSNATKIYVLETNKPSYTVSEVIINFMSGN